MLKHIRKKLTDLGLSEKHQTVYFAVLQLGVAKTKEIAGHTGLPRQTTYSILELLSDKNLVDQHDKSGVKQFSADPRRLIEITEKAQQALLEEKRKIEMELPELEATRFRSSPLPKIQYYEGKNGLHKLIDDILKQHRAGEKIFRGYGVNQMRVALGDYLFTFIKKRHELGVKTHLMIGQGPDDLALNQGALGREVKRLSMSSQDAALYIVGNKIYIFSYVDSVGCMIENFSVAKLFKNIFDDHWQRVK